jgi:hypothetical protein
MAPIVIKRAERHEIFVPKGTVTVADVYPRMKLLDLNILLRLRSEGKLTNVMKLQIEDADAAFKIIQSVQSAHQTEVVKANSSDSPEIIGVSASFDEFHDFPGSIQSDISREPSADAPVQNTESARRLSVKERVQLMQAQKMIDRPELKEILPPGSIGLHGLSGSNLDVEEDTESVGLRVQGSHVKNEVVERLSSKRPPTIDENSSKNDSSESTSMADSTLAEDAKLYQERLNNRSKLVKRDGSSFKAKKEGSSPKADTEKTVPKVSAARLQILRAKHSLHQKHAPGDPVDAVYSYDELRNRTIDELATNPYPSGIDEENREQYLKDDEFFQVFGMTKSDFNSIAKWRKIEMKKKKNLYY